MSRFSRLNLSILNLGSNTDLFPLQTAAAPTLHIYMYVEHIITGVQVDV